MILEIPTQSYVAWRTCITLFHVIASLSTLFRIRERYQSRQMWLDDYLVILPMTVNLVYCIIPWILPSVSPDPRTAQLSDYSNSWATFLFSFTIIWFSRICFMLSLARILPLGWPSRSRVLLISWLFAILYCICMVLAALHCDPTRGSDRHCVVFATSHPAFTYVYTVDIFSIMVMVICPLVVLWKIKLPKQENRIILAALSGSTMILLVFGALLVFAYAPFQKSSVPYLIVICMLWNMMAAASLLSSNALVIVTVIFRAHRFRRPQLEAIERGRGAPHKANPELTGTRRTMSVQESVGLENSGPASPVYSLTDISMEEFDSQNRPPDSCYFLPSEASLAPNRHLQ